MPDHIPLLFGQRWRRQPNHNALETTGTAALLALMTWMRSRRHGFEMRQIATQGGVGVVATAAYAALNDDLNDAQGFWDTAKYLLATYGAYEAYQLVRFNLDYFRFKFGTFDLLDGDPLNRPRPNSRMLLSSGYFWESFPPRFPGPMTISGFYELQPLLMVMAAALLVERLKLRRQLNIAPLTALGILRLSQELPVTRSRRG